MNDRKDHAGFLFFNLFFNFFGCAGSLLLSRLYYSCGNKSYSSCSTQASHCSGFSWHMGLVVPQHVGSSQIRDRTHVSGIDRWILYG